MNTTIAAGFSRAAWDKMSPRTRRLLLGIVASLLVWLGLVSFVSPQRAARLRVEDEVASMLPETEALRQQIAALQNGGRGEDALRDSLNALRAQVEETLASVPENRALSSSLQDLTAPEAGDEVDFLSITPLSAEQRGELMEVPFTIELKGTYRSVTRYLARIEALPRLVTVQRVTLESLPGGKYPELRASIAAATYTLGKNP